MSHAADMTLEGAVVCQRCRYSFEFGTQLHYMASKDGIRPGRNLCQGCYNYYLNKPPTVRRPAGKSIFALRSLPFIPKLITDMFLKPAAGSEHPDDSLESLIRSKVVATIPLPAMLQSACKHRIELMASKSMYVRNTIVLLSRVTLGRQGDSYKRF